MMDGRVWAIRQALDANGFAKTQILSYAAKFASVFYGPFREAAECAPRFGDRASYQQAHGDAGEAIYPVPSLALPGSIHRHEVDDGIKASAEAGVTFVLFYFPSRWEVYWDQINKQLEFPSKLDIDRLRRQVVEYCATKKILCLDLTAPLKRAASQNQQLYFRTDGHWNQEGHRVVAQAMREFLTAAGVAR
jgi:hypothetical protein